MPVPLSNVPKQLIVHCWGEIESESVEAFAKLRVYGWNIGRDTHGDFEVEIGD